MALHAYLQPKKWGLFLSSDRSTRYANDGANDRCNQRDLRPGLPKSDFRSDPRIALLSVRGDTPRQTPANAATAKPSCLRMPVGVLFDAIWGVHTRSIGSAIFRILLTVACSITTLICPAMDHAPCVQAEVAGCGAIACSHDESGHHDVDVADVEHSDAGHDHEDECPTDGERHGPCSCDCTDCFCDGAILTAAVESPTLRSLLTLSKVPIVDTDRRSGWLLDHSERRVSTPVARAVRLQC